MTQNNRSLARNQQGFTLIEIIAVLVLLGILAAVAVPKYFDLQDGAAQNAVNAVAGNLSSASSMNFAASLLNATGVESIKNCTDVEKLLDGGLPDNYKITALAITTGTVSCTLKGEKNKTATFTAHFVE
jgi:MSHA pilin protein MshA